MNVLKVAQDPFVDLTPSVKIFLDRTPVSVLQQWWGIPSANVNVSGRCEIFNLLFSLYIFIYFLLYLLLYLHTFSSISSIISSYVRDFLQLVTFLELTFVMMMPITCRKLLCLSRAARKFRY